jgi:predicted acyltransferase
MWSLSELSRQHEMETVATKQVQPHDDVMSRSLNSPTSGKQPARLLSLDGLRGFDMFWIVGGGEIARGLAKVWPGTSSAVVLQQLEHVPWAGLHFFDVIWTLFMFMVGISLSLSIASRRRMHQSDRSIGAHAIRRALILFVLGMVAQGNLLEFNLATLHPFYSVLHGIAAGYLIATVVALKFRAKGQAVITAVFLASYWILLLTIPVPGVGRGVLTPTGNAAFYIDNLIQGRFHFGENTWFLSYLGFASSVLLGVLAGELLLSEYSKRVKCLSLFICGAGLLLLGLLWSIWLPIIKLLWTSSFVLVAGGLSCLFMATFYLIIDVLGYKKWVFPFTVIGINALAVYMATEIFDFRKIGNVFVGYLLPRIGRWDEALASSAAFAIVWLILYWMYRTRSFVKL